MVNSIGSGPAAVGFSFVTDQSSNRVEWKPLTDDEKRVLAELEAWNVREGGPFSPWPGYFKVGKQTANAAKMSHWNQINKDLFEESRMETLPPAELMECVESHKRAVTNVLGEKDGLFNYRYPIGVNHYMRPNEQIEWLRTTSRGDEEAFLDALVYYINNKPRLLGVTAGSLFHLMCYGVTKEEVEKILPRLRWLDFSHIGDVELIKKGVTLSTCLEYLNLTHTDIKELPVEALPQCQQFIVDYALLETVPRLPVATYIRCYDCPNLKKLPRTFPKCEKLNLLGCTAVNPLPVTLTDCEVTGPNDWPKPQNTGTIIGKIDFHYYGSKAPEWPWNRLKNEPTR